MGRDVDKFVKKDIDDRVTSHLGTDASEPHSPFATQSAPALRSILSSPGGIKQAMVVNEILSKPKSLRDS
jgi:hypothetical protein